MPMNVSAMPTSPPVLCLWHPVFMKWSGSAILNPSPCLQSHQMKYLPMLGDLGWAVLQYISRFGERGVGHTAIKASFALTDQIDVTSYLEAFVK